MKITRIETFKFWVDWCNWLFVRVDDGRGTVRLGRGFAARCDRVGRDGDPRVRAAPDRPGSGRARAALASPLSRVALARRRGAADGAGRARHRAVGPRGQAPGRAGRAACSAARCAPTLRGYASHWLQGADNARQGAFDGAREAVRRGFTAFKCRPFSFEGLRDNEAGEIRQRRGADRSRARRAGPDGEIFIECSEFLSPRTAVLLDDALASVPPGLVRGADPVREREGDGAAAARHRDADRHRRAPAVALRVPRDPRERRLPHHPARPDACRRLHRDPQDRRAGRHVLRPGRAA